MRRLTLLLGLLLALSGHALGAITTSGSASSQTTPDGAPTQSITWNHTIPAGCTGAAGCILVMGCGIDHITKAVNAPTFNGDALTQRGRVAHATNGISSELWYRVAPDIGTFTMSVGITTSAEPFGCWAMAYTGVDQSTPWRGTVTTGTNSGTAISSTVTTVADDLVIDIVTINRQSDTLTFDASQTEILAPFQATASDGTRIGGSTELATGTSTAMSGTQSAAQGWTQVASSLIPQAAAAGRRRITIQQSQLRRAYETLLATLLPHPALAGVR